MDATDCLLKAREMLDVTDLPADANEDMKSLFAKCFDLSGHAILAVDEKDFFGLVVHTREMVRLIAEWFKQHGSPEQLEMFRQQYEEITGEDCPY